MGNESGDESTSESESDPMSHAERGKLGGRPPMSLSPNEYDAVLAQAAQHNPEFLQNALGMQRGLTEALLTVAQYETDEPEKRELLDELEENAREIGLIGSDDEDECNCSCSTSSSSASAFDSTDANGADLEPELDPDALGKILDAAAQAANNTDGEPSSGSLAEYRERQAQANAAEGGDTEDVDGMPASLSKWRKTEDGKQAIEENEERRPSLIDFLRAP